MLQSNFEVFKETSKVTKAKTLLKKVVFSVQVPWSCKEPRKQTSCRKQVRPRKWKQTPDMRRTNILSTSLNFKKKKVFQQREIQNPHVMCTSSLDFSHHEKKQNKDKGENNNFPCPDFFQVHLKFLVIVFILIRCLFSDDI